MFLFKSPHRGDSNEYTQYTIFNIKKKITLNYPKSAAMEFCSKGLKKEFQTAMLNEPSEFEHHRSSTVCQIPTVTLKMRSRSSQHNQVNDLS